ncbi:MAG: hypothetical protein ACOH5I_24510 [Oligoflexus sp.]
MKNMLFAFIAVVSSLVFGTVSKAEEVCFYIQWNASEEGNQTGQQKPGVQYFVTLNGSEKVGFRKENGSERYGNDKVVSSKSKGCISSGRFKLGTNYLNFTFHIGDGTGIIDEGYLAVALKMIFPNKTSRSLFSHRFTADPNRTLWTIDETFTISIEEVDPNTAAYVRTLQKQVSLAVDDYNKTRESYFDEKSRLEKIIADIQSKNFDEISLEDLEGFLEAKEKFRVLSENIQGKQEEVAIKTSKLKDVVAEVKRKIEEDLIAEGYDFTREDFYQIPIDYSLILDDAHASGDNPFGSWAESTIEELKYILGNDQKIQFLEKVRFWTSQAESFIEAVKLRAITHPEDLNSLVSAINRVEGYIYGNESGEKGVLDRDHWFKDNPVPVSFRKDLEDALIKTNDPNLKILANSVRNWTSPDGKLTDNQKAVLALSYGMWNLGRILRSIPKPQKQDFPEFDESGRSREEAFRVSIENYNKTLFNYRNMLLEIQSAAEQAVDLRVSLSPLSPVKALCEIITQRKWCAENGEKIDITDNALNLVDIFPYFGTSAIFISSVKKSVLEGVEIFGEGFEATVKIVNSAGKLGMSKSDDIKNFAKATSEIPSSRVEKIVDASRGISPSSSVQSIDSDVIKFSQSSVNRQKVMEITESMKKHGWLDSDGTIDVVKMHDGTLISVDNKRVLAAHNAGIKVKAIVRSSTESIDLERAKYLRDKQGNLPKNWGEAVTNRIANQKKLYRETYPNGSYVTGLSE